MGSYSSKVKEHKELKIIDRAEMYLLGVAVFFVAVLFNFSETWYFGWNLRPQSSAEMVCDYISFAGMMGGMFIVMYAWIEH